MSRTKIRGASTFDLLKTFCGIQESALLHCTAKQPPFTSNAISQELLPQQSSLHVRMLLFLRKIEKFPAFAPARSVARYHSRPSCRQFFKLTKVDFELTFPTIKIKRELVHRQNFDFPLEHDHTDLEKQIKTTTKVDFCAEVPKYVHKRRKP